MDCEMTGLDPEKHVLLEIATIITNYDLEIVARGPVLAIRHPKSKMDMMDAWRLAKRERGVAPPLPLDPSGTPFVLNAAGDIEVSRDSKLFPVPGQIQPPR